jgi:hypothetical protein
VNSGFLQVSPELLTKIAIAALVLMLSVYAGFNRRFAFLPFLAPAVVYFFTARSLQNYFMYWPIVLAAYLFVNWRSDERDSKLEYISRRKLAAIAVSAVCALALLLPLPDRGTVHIAIAGTHTSGVTGRIDGLRVAVTNSGSQARSIHFDLLQQGDGVDLQQWAPKRSELLAAHSHKLFSIRAPSVEYGLAAGGEAAARVLAIDAAGNEYASAALALDIRPPKIENADLSYWSAGSRPFPIGWNVNTADWRGGRVAEAYVDGRRCVALKVRSSSASWQLAAVQQHTDARPGALAFRLFPEVNYTADEKPRSLFGVFAVDVVGHEVYLTIDSRLRRPVLIRALRRSIFVYPGRLLHWNTITLDLQKLHDQTGFVLSPNATMLLGVVDAVSRTGPGVVSGYFGGVAEKGM